MKKQAMKADIVNDTKQFLLRVGKRVYDNGKHIRYVDYNNMPRKLTRVYVFNLSKGYICSI